ncbi:putative tail tube protein [Escherichia coli]|nr:putative tail tube protein [Escherichia coli]
MPALLNTGVFSLSLKKDKDRRPMLLAQRLDEVHFKGTILPIEQTFWREFGLYSC